MRFAIAAGMLVALLWVLDARAADDAAAFAFKDEPGQYLDILYGGKIVGRYMYAYDKSTPAKLKQTYKTFLHVFDAEGKAPITNGTDGKNYPHHRGIFAGWNKMSFGGKSYDRWHMAGGEQVHQKYAEQKADKDQAAFTSVVNWNDEKGQAMIEEERAMTFRTPPAGAYALIDFVTKLKAPAGDVVLDGDPEHAGVQYRPADAVDTKATVYMYPKENAKPHADLDYPWVGETYKLGDKKYSVVMFNHPENPKQTRFSAYRDYGRFGAFPKATIKSGAALTLKYRFLIAEGEMPGADAVQKCGNEFTGANDPAPKTTVIPAEGAASKK